MSSDNKDSIGWSTAAEVDFIWYLATQPNAITLLEGYIAATKKRVNFGRIDPKIVIAVARERLAVAIEKLSA
ncbi:hypothetical protein [Burkholderia singularis]|uniref:Uncharacterized protein n=1 Tax=Burkholderia singularis TaxID=1503053 RepID=A0A238H6S1_9BURK|nr:hypothetical protein [Burkholderia singularis]SMG01046.1 hypothetical protein BSIN_4032 [Burkholderia singularis]